MSRQKIIPFDQVDSSALVDFFSERGFSQETVACVFDDVARVLGDCRVDDVGPQPVPGSDGAVRVLFHESCVADHVRSEDRREPALKGLLAHGRFQDFAVIGRSLSR